MTHYRFSIILKEHGFCISYYGVIPDSPFRLRVYGTLREFGSTYPQRIVNDMTEEGMKEFITQAKLELLFQ